MARSTGGGRRLAGVTAVVAGVLIGMAGPVGAAVPPTAVSPESAPAAVAATAAATDAPSTAGVSAVRTGGDLRVAARSALGRVQVITRLSGHPFSAGVDIGGPIVGVPTLYYQATTRRLDVFVVGTDHKLRVRSQLAGRWGSWTVLGSGVWTSGPAVTRLSDGSYLLYAVGTDRILRQLQVRGSTVIGILRLGTAAAGSPAVSYSGSRLAVFWTGLDGRIMRRISTVGRWSAAGAITGGGFTPGLGVARLIDGRYRLVATSSGGGVYQLLATTTSAGSVQALGNHVHGQPAVTTDSAGHTDVLVVGWDGRIKDRTSAGVWMNASGRGYGTYQPTTSWSAPTSGPDLATMLLGRWGKTLIGNRPGVLADLQAAAAGRSISTPCGTLVKIDPLLLQLMIQITDRYTLSLNNIITGHSCDSGWHPKGAAFDAGDLADARSGAKTNFDSGAAGDNDALDRQFVEFLGAHLPSGGSSGHGGGIGQRYCGSRGSAQLPAYIIFFDDSCNHQHAQLYTN